MSCIKARVRSFLRGNIIPKAMNNLLEKYLANIQLLSTKYKHQTLINSYKYEYQIPLDRL